MSRLRFLLVLVGGFVQSIGAHQPACDSPEKPQWGYNQLQNIVCYEHVRVITIAVGPEPLLSPDCAKCDYDVRLLLSEIDCDGCMTVIEPWYGASRLTAPFATTISPPSDSGDRPTVVIYTSATDYVNYIGTSQGSAPVLTRVRPDNAVANTEPSIPASYITTTIPYTRYPPITRPLTRTILPPGKGPGTVVVETPTVPPTTSSISTAGYEEPEIPEETGGGGIDDDEDIKSEPQESPSDPDPQDSPTNTPTITPTITPTDTEPEPTRTVSPAGPTFDCDEGGYLIQGRTLYRLNLVTGENVAVNTRVGPGGNINALGFNSLDGYLYAFVSIGGGEQQLIRISADGTYDLLPLVVENGLNVGDIDNEGQMWASDAGRRWIQVDLSPGSSTFGEQVDEGVSQNGNVADWVYLEGGGDYLYSIRLGASATAQRWSRSSHEWETIRTFVLEGHNGFGALYAVDGELWGSDNQSGDIVAFPVLSESEDARKISDGPSTSSNDGARCFRAPAPNLPTQ